MAGLVLGLVFGLIEGFSIFSLALSRDLGVERGEASGMYSTYLLSSTLSAPLAGRLIDWFGPRRVVLFSFPVFSFGIALCSQATQLWQLYVIYIALIATTTTTLIVSSQVIVNNGYSENRGKALGIAYACVGLGNFVLFNVLGVLVQYAGWRTAYLTAAAVALAGGVVFSVLARSLPSAAKAAGEAAGEAPEETGTAEAEETGTGKTGEAEGAEEAGTAETGAGKTRTADTAAAEKAGDSAAPVRSVFLRPAFLFLFCAALAASVLDFVVFQHLVPFLVTSGYSESSAGFMLGLASLGYIAGQLGAGILSDRHGREIVGGGSAVAFALGLIGVWLLPATWFVGAAAALLGLSIGGVIGCRSAALGDLFAGSRLGRVSGMIQVASAIGAAFGTWIGGFGFDLTGGYTLTFGIALGCSVAWTAALWLAAPRRAQQPVPEAA